MYVNNNKIIKKVRKLEYFYLTNIKQCNRLKKEYFKRNPENWKKLKSLILDSDEMVFILKDGFRLNINKMKEYASKDRIDKLFDTFHLSTSVLQKIVNDKAFDDLIKEERFYINQIIIMHYPIIVKIVSKSTSKSPFLTNYFYEIYNEGIIGIIHTIHKFDADKGAKFITYAYKWVQYYVHKYINNLIRNIDFNNGNFNKYAFNVNEVIDCSYEDYLDSLHNCPIDLINLYDGKLDFVTLNRLHTTFNKMINNNNYRKKFLKECSILNIESYNKILNYNLDDKIIARLLLEKMLPLNKSNLDNSDNNIITQSVDKQVSNENHDDYHDKRTIEQILELVELNDKDRKAIENYLYHDENIYKINGIIKKIQKQLSRKNIDLTALI